MTDSPYTTPENGSQQKLPSNISILSNIFTSPGLAFKDLQVAYPILLPLLTILILNALVVVILFANIDFAWYVDHIAELQGADLSKAEQDQIRQGMQMMSPTMFTIFGVVGVAVVLAVVFTVMSLYLVIVSSFTNDGFQFKQWFSLVSWTAMPSLIATLASLVVILTSSNGQIPPESINPLSFNELFFGLNAVKGLGNILASSDITMIWSIALMALGYANWTKNSLGKSFVIVIIPYVIYFSVRFLML